MLRTYETIYVVNAELSDEAVEAVSSKIKGFITSSGGEIGHDESWGVRTLSFNIKGQIKGKYNYLLYTAKPDIIKEIEFYLKIAEPVLTYLTVKISETASLENVPRPNVKDIL